jgi:hypothetical protein
MREKSMAQTYIDERGYLRFSDSGKLVHRWVAEKMLGRYLYPEEVVHHIDRNKLNNAPENLTVFPNQDEHEAEHDAAGDFDYQYL